MHHWSDKCQRLSCQEGLHFFTGNLKLKAQSEYDLTSAEDSIYQQTLWKLQHHELIVGKDRELFSFSVDLKWLFSRFIDPAWWMSLFRNIGDQLSPFKCGSTYDYEAKEISLEICSQIRRLSRSSIVKVFGGTLQEAQEYCIVKNRLLILYVEDRVNKQNIFCRRSLADNSIGGVVNDRFVLYVGSVEHYATMRFAKSLGAKSFSYFVILHVPVSLRNGTLIKEFPEVLGSLNVDKDLRPDKILRFFAKALEFHSSALVEDKKVLAKAESMGRNFIPESIKTSLMGREMDLFGKKGEWRDEKAHSGI